MDTSTTNAYLGGLASGAFSVWFFFWYYRQKYELDEKLDDFAQRLRWVIVLSGFGGAMLPGPGLAMVRVGWGVLSVGFLAWPNFAYHLARLIRRRGPPEDDADANNS